MTSEEIVREIDEASLTLLRLTSEVVRLREKVAAVEKIVRDTPFDGEIGILGKLEVALGMATDQSGPCGAMFSFSPQYHCKLENDHDGPHDMVYDGKAAETP